MFRPALAVLAALPAGRAVDDAIRVVAECANRVADSLSDLGYDHADRFTIAYSAPRKATARSIRTTCRQSCWRASRSAANL